MSCCHEQEAKQLRQRVQALQDEISDLTDELARIPDQRWEIDNLTDELAGVVAAVEDHARGVVTLNELVETATGKRP